MIVLVFLLFCFFGAGLNAQYDNKNTADLKTEALKNFESDNFSEALIQYKSLLSRYPKDAIFSYYCGLSLLNMNKDIPTAIVYLEFASSKPTVPYNVFYHLGDAYTRNYQFEHARKAYAQFTDIATKTEEKDLMSGRLSEMSGNAIALTTSYNQIDILASSLFSFSDSLYIRQLRSPGGALSLKPAEFLPTQDGINDMSNLMFIPRNLEKGEFLFYAGYGKNKKRGTDIFMVKAGNGRRYSEPVAVDVLNSEFDEVLPYYDPIGKDLIFSSKGHNSMGGYDLFKSHYDSERNSWTPPTNLGFPVNSPSNEFLMIPGTDMGSIMLITDRQGLDSMITAYMLRIHEPRVQMAKADPAELKKIGNFGGIEAIPDMLDMSAEDILSSKESVAKPQNTEPIVNRPKPEDIKMEMPAEQKKYLRLALEQQFKADSLAKLAREWRIKVKSVPEPDERWSMQKKIISWEKESSDCQARADEYYLLVKKQESGTAETKKVPDAIQKDTVINDITVYTYKPPVAKNEVQEQSPQAVTEVEKPAELIKPIEAVAEIQPVKAEDKTMNRFTLLDKSPYSANNPFPEDTDIPKGAYYKIQLAVLSQNPEWTAFGKLSPVTYENVAGKPMKKYYAGKFTAYESAKSSLEEVRRNGFPEAFIVGWFDGQKMTVAKVAELEKK
jgi:tetratricopeptide (TPR) repeat protein